MSFLDKMKSSINSVREIIEDLPELKEEIKDEFRDFKENDWQEFKADMAESKDEFKEIMQETKDDFAEIKDDYIQQLNEKKEYIKDEFRDFKENDWQEFKADMAESKDEFKEIMQETKDDFAEIIEDNGIKEKIEDAKNKPAAVVAAGVAAGVAAVVAPVITPVALAKGAVVLVNFAAESVSNETEAEIKEKNLEIESLVNLSQHEVQRSADLLNERNTAMINLKKEIYENELNDYLEELKKIKNIISENIDFDIPEQINFTKISLDDYIQFNNYEHTNDELNIAESFGIVLSSLLNPVGTFGVQVYKMFKRDNQLDIVNTNYEKAKIECEKLKQQSLIFDDAKDRCNEVFGILNTLRNYLGMATQKLSEICEANKYDYKMFSREEKEVVMASLNLAQGVKSVISIPIVTEDGCLNKDALTVIEKSKQLKKFEASKIEGGENNG